MNGVRFNSKTCLKVKSRKVQRKNRSTPTTGRGFVLDRESPGRGFKHYLTKKDVYDFLELLPHWKNLIFGIERVLLSKGDENIDGTYQYFHREETGLIKLMAWNKNPEININLDYFLDHKKFFDRIHLKNEISQSGARCWFTEFQIKAFILIHVFLHELGHHRYSMESKAPAIKVVVKITQKTLLWLMKIWSGPPTYKDLDFPNNLGHEHHR